MLLIARVVRIVAALVVALIVVGIALIVLGANDSNSIVSTLLDGARWLAHPFQNVFHLDGKKANVAVNWGLAAVVYAVVAGLIVRAIVWMGAARMSTGPAAPRRRAIY
jgi:hypothetical protein